MIHLPTCVFILGLLVPFGLAELDPKYQKPRSVTAVSYAGIEPNSCGNSSLNVLAGQDDIYVGDCVLITHGWLAEGDFVLLATDWVNSTGDADHFYSQYTNLCILARRRSLSGPLADIFAVYETRGTCQFAFKRTDANQNDVRYASLSTPLKPPRTRRKT